MKSFWRPHPLDEKENILLVKLFEAHSSAVFRDNISSSVLQLAYFGNGNDFTKAAAAALSTLGGLHAPILETCELLSDETFEAETNVMFGMEQGYKIPGWGSSFNKGKPDPIVDNVLIYMDAGWPWMVKRINNITQMLHDQKKFIFPNMAAITAATAIIIGLPKELASVLLLHGRALSWAELIYAKADTERPTPA